MARILVSLAPFPAHIFPVVPIAQALRDRGHEVLCHAAPGYAALFAEAGLPYTPPRHAPNADVTAIQDLTAREGTDPVGAAEAVTRVFLDPAPDHVRDMDGIAAEFRPDVVLADNARYGAAIFSAWRGVPLATVNVTSLNLPGPDTPPYGPGLPPPRSQEDRERYRRLEEQEEGIYGQRAAVERASLAAFNAARAAFGLPPHAGPLAVAALSPYLHILPTTEDLEYRRSDLPPQVHFVGPCLWDGAAINLPVPAWVQRLGVERPAIYVTQGTAENRRYTLIRPTVEALAGEPVDVAITLGIGRDPAALEPLPPNAHAAGFVPQSVLLPRVSAVVTNGGHGSVLGALSHGVPLVLAARGFDRAENAQRCVEAGVGLRLDPETLTSEVLRAGIRRVLDEPQFRHNARRVQAGFARHNGPLEAALLIERLAATKQPVI